MFNNFKLIFRHFDANIFFQSEPFAKLGFLFKIKACDEFYHRHIIDIPRIKF